MYTLVSLIFVMSVFSFIGRPGSKQHYIFGRYREDQVTFICVV